MNCPHCHGVITKVWVYRSVVQRSCLLYNDDEAHRLAEETIEFPAGAPRYQFRCSFCGGDLHEHQRRLLIDMKRAAKRSLTW